MRTQFKLHLLLSLLLFTISPFISSNTAQAQENSLLDGWCQQPTDVHLSGVSVYGYPWTRSIGASEGGIRAVYQPYNQRIILQRSVPREVVAVLETGVILNEFQVVRFTANCRYVITHQIDQRGLRSLVVYDLLSESATRMGTIVDMGRGHPLVEPSPDGNYLLVTNSDGLYLWNLTANSQTNVTALARTDCEFAGGLSCTGEIRTYREARWDVPHGLLQLDLINNYTVTLTIPTLEISRIEGTYRAITQDESERTAVIFNSEYACLPRVQYQTYNRRIVLKNRLTSELVAVVEDGLDLSGFQFLGWSTTCRYIAAALEDTNGLRLAVWDIETGTRQEHPISDWVDSARWSAVGDVISVRTDGEQFEWNVSGQ